MSETTPVFRHYEVATQVTRDQVAAALRDVGRPATARQVGELLNYVYLSECDGDHCAGNANYRLDRHYGGGLDVQGYSGMMACTIRPHLEALAKKGMATREKVGRSVLWSWAGEPVDMSGVEHLDFATPSEADIVMEDLAVLGVEVERVADPIKSERGRVYAASIERRKNGPLQYFRIELWEKATAEAALAALRDAVRLVQSPGDRFEASKYGLCLGSPVTVGGEA